MRCITLTLLYLHLLGSRLVPVCQGSGGDNDLISAGAVQCVHEKIRVKAPGYKLDRK